MNKRALSMLAAVSASGLMLSGCVTDPETGKKKLNIPSTAIGGVAGAVGGYLLGDLLGGKNDRTAKVVGAGIGGLAGAGVGYYMDQQEKKMRERTSGSGIEVDRQGDQIVLNMPGDVTFATDSATINASFRASLDQVAATLAEYPQTYIDIYGHTDSRGSEVYNQGLSERRAAAVANYLATRGVQSVRMATKGYGETALKCSPEVTAADYQCNRRVEIRVVPVTQNDVNAAR